MRISDWSSDVCSSDLHSPPESGVIARSASGALETVAWVRVVNPSRALEEIAEAQYWRIGLTGDTETTLGETLEDGQVEPVLGPGGDGTRQNVRGQCDGRHRTNGRTCGRGREGQKVRG